MKVDELIKKLESYPKDAEILVDAVAYRPILGLDYDGRMTVYLLIDTDGIGQAW